MEMIILIGLQASGKSTFYRTHFAETHEHVSKDRLRNNRHPASRQRQLIIEAFQAGCSVVVDNTNVTREDRAELIALGHQYGVTVTGYFFAPEVKRSLERNKLRGEKERVPNIGIFATLKKLTRPSYNEGFAKLYDVRSNDDFTFAVSEWVEVV